MKRHLFQSISAICLIATLSLASCNKEDIPGEDPEVQQPAANEITFTATLAPKGEGPLSKAISTGTDANDKEILNVEWAVNEKIALYYQTSSGYAKATAKVTEVNDGVATIEATLDANTLDGGAVNFVYPSTLANDTGNDIDESKLMTQYGKIDGIANSISKKFDAATGDGIIVLSGGTTLPTTATVTNEKGTGTVSLQNRVCICKFRLTVYTIGVNGTLATLFSGTNDDLTISDGDGHTYNIKSTKEWPGAEAPAGATGNPGYATGDDIYVAMLPIENKPLTLSLTYKDNSVIKNLTLTTKPGTLAAGKFYRNVPVTMQLENMDITGDITHTLTVPAGMTVTVNGANIDVTSAPAIVLEDKATLILKGTNTVRATLADAIQCNGNATIEFQSTTNTITAVTVANNGIQIADGQSLNITGTGSASVSGGIDLQSSAVLKFNGTAANHDIFIPDATTLSTGGITVGSTITIGIGETFTLSWTTLSVTSGPGIQCSGNATIILDGTNSITSSAATCRPGIQAGGSGTTLTIQGSGSMTVRGGEGSAGIGGENSGTCGNIIIDGGDILAYGSSGCAAIGSGNYGDCGDITITNNVTKVIAVKSTSVTSYSIGKSFEIEGFPSTCGIITIGGTVYYDGTNFQNGGETYLATSPLVYQP